MGPPIHDPTNKGRIEKGPNFFFNVKWDWGQTPLYTTPPAATTTEDESLWMSLA